MQGGIERVAAIGADWRDGIHLMPNSCLPGLILIIKFPKPLDRLVLLTLLQQEAGNGVALTLLLGATPPVTAAR